MRTELEEQKRIITALNTELAGELLSRHSVFSPHISRSLSPVTCVGSISFAVLLSSTCLSFCLY
jgi:hypothetical protein